MIQTVALTKTFKDFWRRGKVKAVDNLDLVIPRGQIFGLLGPNGSGKSTTIKMLLGLLYPTRGRIAVFGKAPTDVQVKGRIGFLPEESYLYSFLNARETLDFYGRLFHLARPVRKKRIEMLLEMVGLKHEAKRRVGEYSKGMARRIGLAQALMNDPEFLILDEPTSGMDPIGTRQIKNVIHDLGARGKTILLSSHLLADVEDVCHRVSILYGGKQRTAGDIKELLAQKGRTQITTDHLSDETIQKIRDLVERVEHKNIVSVTHPKEKLETLFLRIVEEANRENQYTAGARTGGAVPDFLSNEDDRGAAVIDDLIHAADRKPVIEPVEPIPPLPSRDESAHDVLEDLVKPEPVEPLPAERLDAADESAGQQDKDKLSKADRGVIDDLLR